MLPASTKPAPPNGNPASLRHGGAEFNLAGRQAIEHGISMGRRSVWLKLTREQYAKLRG
jgi:hypothetical protein